MATRPILIGLSHEPIRFGPFALDPATGELRRDGVPVPIAPQPFRLLVALASRPGELVTRDELRRAVWGDETFVDFERGLNFCVLQARTALGDEAKNPTYIETLPKRGYRWIAPLTQPSVVAQLAPDAAATGVIAAPAPRRPARWLSTVAVLLLVTIVVAASHRVERPRAATGAREMLAVLPFENQSSPADAHFADGVTEELITHLGRLDPRRLGVIARTSVLSYRDGSKNVREIGRELGVAYVVEGSVRREGQRVRVTAKLVDASDQSQVWAESFDRSGARALAIQQEVADEIVRALRLRLLDSRDAITSTVPAAHEAYLRGRHLWNRGSNEDVQQAIAELRQAVRLDRNYVLAHIALAEAVHTLAMRSRIEPSMAAAEIRAASQAALRLAPNFAQSHATAALLSFWYEWKWDDAERSYRRAIELNPGEAGALHDHGWLLIARGDADEGIAEIRRAQELDPLSPRANMHVAWAYIYTRRYDAAIHESMRVLERWPDNREAEACLHVARKLRDGATPEELRERLARAVERESDGDRALRDPYDVAVAYAWAGERDKAFVWLDRALAQRNISLPLLAADPKLDALRADRRYEALLRKIGVRQSVTASS